MKQTITSTIKLNAEEIKQILLQHYNQKEGNVQFVVRDTSDDRFGMYPSYSLTEAQITVELDASVFNVRK